MKTKLSNQRWIAFLLIIVALVSLLAMPAAAITLADSFSGGTYYGSQPTIGGSNVTKYCYAKTSGYYYYHYVRAQMGDLDTGRAYSYGDIYRSVNMSSFVPSWGFYSQYFPTGYAWYGY